MHRGKYRRKKTKRYGRKKGKDIKKKCQRKGCKKTIVIPSRFASVADKRKYCGTRCAGLANRSNLTEVERFKAKLSKNKNGCILWMGGTNGAEPPIGLFRRPGKTSLPAHRYAYNSYHGTIPKSQVIRQTCGNSLCCKIEHLELVSRSEVLTGALPRGQKHWKSKLTKKKVRAIRKDAAAGVPQKKLAKKYKISEAQISLIVNRVSWAWVT